MSPRHRFPRRRSRVGSDPQAQEDLEARQPKVSEKSRVLVILLLIGLVCFPISLSVQSYLSVSNMFLLFIFCVYLIPVYMVAAAHLLILVIGDETRHKEFRACSA